MSNSGAQIQFGVGTDTFSDQTINSSVGNSLSRNTGSTGSSGTRPAGYVGTLGTGLNYAYSATASANQLFIVPKAGDPGLSTEDQDASITFSFTDALNAIFGFGANFSGTNILGENITTGTFKLVATNAANETLTQNFSAAGFYGFRSSGDSRLTSVVLSSTNSAAYATVDNVALSAVPTPDSYLLMLSGMGALVLITRRRKQL